MSQLVDDLMGGTEELPEIPALRLFKVYKPGLPNATNPVHVYAHTYDTRDGVLIFTMYQQQTRKGRDVIVMFCPRAFKTWDDVEEVVIPETSGKAN